MRNITDTQFISPKRHIRYLEPLRIVSKINRKKPTKSENKIWYELLNNHKMGYKFTRQKPIGRFVADFYCSELLIIIEVNGGSHQNKTIYDQERDKYLKCLGIATYRYQVDEVLNNLKKVEIDLARKILLRKLELKLPCQGESRKLSGRGLQ